MDLVIIIFLFVLYAALNGEFRPIIAVIIIWVIIKFIIEPEEVGTIIIGLIVSLIFFWVIAKTWSKIKQLIPKKEQHTTMDLQSLLDLYKPQTLSDL